MNKTYLNDSPLFYKAPRALDFREAHFWAMYHLYTKLYFAYIGRHVNDFLSKLVYINRVPPISLIYDWNDTDEFQFKARMQFKVFIAFCFIAALSAIQLFRVLCCKKVRRVKRKFK